MKNIIFHITFDPWRPQMLGHTTSFKKGMVIKGKVLGTDGEPIIGATIKEEGTSNGAITDFDGNYSLTVSSPDAILQFSYVGYKSEEFMADKGVINVTMREDTERLDEVVVTALGIKRAEKALSYNVQQVKSEELVRVKDAN